MTRLRTTENWLRLWKDSETTPNRLINSFHLSRGTKPFVRMSAICGLEWTYFKEMFDFTSMRSWHMTHMRAPTLDHFLDNRLIVFKNKQLNAGAGLLWVWRNIINGFLYGLGGLGLHLTRRVTPGRRNNKPTTICWCAWGRGWAVWRGFRTFPRPKRRAIITGQSSASVPRHSSSSELSAHQMARWWARDHLDRWQWRHVEDGEIGACWRVLGQHHYVPLPAARALGAPAGPGATASPCHFAHWYWSDCPLVWSLWLPGGGYRSS